MGRTKIKLATDKNIPQLSRNGLLRPRINKLCAKTAFFYPAIFVDKIWGLDHAVKLHCRIFPSLKDFPYRSMFSSNFSERDFKAAEQAGCSGALRVSTLLLLLEAQGATTKLSVLHYRNTVQRQRLTGNLNP